MAHTHILSPPTHTQSVQSNSPSPPPTDTECIAYCPPGALLTRRLAGSLAPWVTSVVVGKDAVPRMTVATLRRLMDDMVTALARCRLHKLHVWCKAVGGYGGGHWGCMGWVWCGCGVGMVWVCEGNSLWTCCVGGAKTNRLVVAGMYTTYTIPASQPPPPPVGAQKTVDTCFVGIKTPPPTPELHWSATLCL